MSLRPLSCCQQCFQKKRQSDVRLWAHAGQKSFGAQHQIVGKQCLSHAWRDCLLQTRQQAAAPARQLDWSPWDTYCARFVDRCCCTALLQHEALVCCVMYPFLTGLDLWQMSASSSGMLMDYLLTCFPVPSRHCVHVLLHRVGDGLRQGPGAGGAHDRHLQQGRRHSGDNCRRAGLRLDQHQPVSLSPQLTHLRLCPDDWS
jgi:hypothetical protein